MERSIETRNGKMIQRRCEYILDVDEADGANGV
jgi:hypothetical protein